MSKTALKSICIIIANLVLILFISAFVVAAEDSDMVELKNGDKLTGTVLTDIYTITTPYSFVTVEKNQISEIRVDDEYQQNDIIELKSGGLVEGTIEEAELSLKLSSGKIIALEKKKCKKIIMRSNK